MSFKRRINKFDEEEIVQYDAIANITIDTIQKTVYFRKAYIPFESVLEAAKQIQEGFDDVEDE